MDLARLRASLLAQAARLQAESPAAAALTAGLGDGPSPVVADLFNRFYRILAVSEPSAPLLVGALHYLALRGDAPALARFFPSCGGALTPADHAALAAAAEAVLEAHQEDVLDFILTHEAQTHVVGRSAAFLLGALATALRFGGGLYVVEVGCSGGLNLTFDRYAYQFGEIALGDSPLRIPVALRGRTASLAPLLAQGMPVIAGRIGLDRDPRDLTDPDQELALAAFLWPEQADQVAQLRQAAELQRRTGRPEIREGVAEEALLPLLAEVYDAMPPGHTLFLCQSMLWPGLTDDERQRTALAVQRLAAHLQPHKPMAWLQVEPFSPTGKVELRLSTFGWADPEDRAVRRLAEADPLLRWVEWLE